MSSSSRRVLALLSRYRRAYAIGVLCLLATNALNLGVPWLLKIAFDGLQHAASASLHVRVAFALVALAVVRGVIRTWSRLAILGTSRRVSADLREEVFAHLQRLPIVFFDRTPTGDIVSRLISDLQNVRSMFGPVAMNAANTAALYVMTIAVLVRLDLALTLLAFVPYLGVSLLMKHYGARMHLESTRTQEALARISHFLSENLTGITVVKCFRRETEEIRRFDELADAHYAASSRFTRTRAVVVPLMGAVSSLSMLVVLLVGGRNVMEGRFSLGDFVAFTTCLAMLSWPSIALGWIVNAWQRGMAAMDRLESLLQEEPEPAQGDAEADALPGAIELRHLTFRHAPAATPALRDVSLRLPAGGRLGVVGRTGSGKSTLVDLLAGLRRPDRGQLFVSGRDACDLTPSRLRSRIGAVPQGAFVFSTTVRDNVAYALPEPPDEARVAAAVRDSALEKDLSQLPEGMDTVIGERGVTLSGGQRQRVTLARALAREPDLLVLDDSLSAVDSETEREILARLDERRRRRRDSEVIVSHRLSAVAACDEILVLDEGRVVERGTHEQLMAHDGLYASAWRAQELMRQVAETE